MKRALCVILILCACLTGCANKQSAAALREESIAYAEENAELFEQCANEVFRLIAQYNLSDEPHSSVCKITMEESGQFLIHPYFSGNDFSTESDLLSSLFRDGRIFEIQVREYAVEFGIDDHRSVSPDVYYKIIYTPSNELTSLFGYNEDMTFEASSGGWFGTLAQSNNTFFYYTVTDHLYYTESKF